MSDPIDFYFDFLSPYAYFASTKIDALASRHGRTVNWKPFLLGVTVMQIMGLKPLMQTPLKSTYVGNDKPRMARLLGIPFTQPDMTSTRSTIASRTYLYLKARDPELAKAFAKRIFERLWVRGHDISSMTDIIQEASELSIDTVALQRSATKEEFRTALRAAVDEAVRNEVFGAPFFIVDGEAIWGVDRLWMLDHWLTYGDWNPAPESPV